MESDGVDLVSFRIAVISTLAPSRGTTRNPCTVSVFSHISTHAPSRGRDYNDTQPKLPVNHFNPRAPHGARLCMTPSATSAWNFNPRAPHRARHHIHGLNQLDLLISTHAPCTGRDTPTTVVPSSAMIFQPTRPTRGATRGRIIIGHLNGISTHAPYAGCDICDLHPGTDGLRISTHVPHMGRDILDPQSEPLDVISTHAPHTGRDTSTDTGKRRRSNFNPRAPHGARPTGISTSRLLN